MSTTEQPVPSTDPGVVLDPAVVALVEAQWQAHQRTVELPQAIRAVIGPAEDARLTALSREQPAFQEWTGHSATTLSLYRTLHNRQRVAWILDLIDEGERIVDVGCGSGAIGGRILEFRRPARYAAIEPSAKQAEAFRGMAAEHGISADRYELHETTGQEAAAAVVSQVDPTLILILEVLEHVNDPGTILCDVALAMPGEADLLISVPVLGCIEHEWGHYSVFDRARLERLCRDAGVHIHWVQPIADTWLFLLLSKSTAPRPRLRRLAQHQGAALAEVAAEDSRYFWQRVAHKSGRLTTEAIPPPEHGSTMRLDTGPAQAVRIRCRADHAEVITTLTAEFHDAKGLIETWALTPAEINKLANVATWVLRRGFDLGRQHNNHRPGATATSLQLHVVTTGADPGLEIQHVERLEPVVNDSQPRSPSLQFPGSSSADIPPSVRTGMAGRVLTALRRRVPTGVKRVVRRWYR